MTKLDAAHRNAIDSANFAFPKERKEPLENAGFVGRKRVGGGDEVDEARIDPDRLGERAGKRGEELFDAEG